jgi:hypothetical protein
MASGMGRTEPVHRRRQLDADGRGCQSDQHDQRVALRAATKIAAEFSELRKTTRPWSA